MCNKAVDNYAHALKFVPDQCKAQKMCIKAVDTHPSTIPDFRVSTAIMLSHKIFTIGGASWTLDPCTQQVYFSQPSCLQQFHMKYKRTNYHVEIWISKFITPCWNWIWQSWFVLLLCWIFRQLLRNYIWWSTLFKKVMTLNTVTSLTVNSVIDIYLQVLQNFQNKPVFKTIFKNTFSQWVNQNTC